MNTVTSPSELKDLLNEAYEEDIIIHPQITMPDGSTWNGMGEVTPSPVIPHIKWNKPVRVLTFNLEKN